MNRLKGSPDNKSNLRVILLSCIAVGLGMSAAHFSYGFENPKIYTMLAFSAVSALCFALNERGASKAAVYVQINASAAVIAFNMALGKGMQDAALLSVPLVMLAGSLFLGTGMSLIASAGIILTVDVVGFLELTGRLEIASTIDLPGFFIYNALLSLAAVIVLFVTKSFARKNEALKAALADRELILREIHHRVKNSLQVTGSLLRIHSRKVDSQGDKEVFLECERRIQALAQAHEKIYAASDLRSVDLSSYLTTLVEASGSGIDGVRFDIDAGGVRLELKKAFPLGLIASELISNSLKHAFKNVPEGKEKRISIRITQSGGGVSFSYEDSGPGFDPDSARPSSIGLSLISSLQSQLDAQGGFESGPGKGCRYTIQFA